MEAATAIRTLELLADGRDPESGQPLPAASPFNQSVVVRSLFAAIRALDSASRQAVAAPAMGAKAAKAEKAAKAAPVHTAAAANGAAPAATRVQPTNAGKPWTADEDAALCAAFDQGLPIRELAGKHGRSTTALNARLFRLGKIADPGIPLRHPVTQLAGHVGQPNKTAPRSRPSSSSPAA
ncbi:MAG: hypothetical protein SF172_13840 [Burkholderiales bacterium]|nr:hypothetical protein [Burkholderiales bacterium]